MKKEAYLNELQKYLKKLPQQDFEQAMEYFQEYFEDAGAEHEAEVIEELGNPREAAAELLETLLERKSESAGSGRENVKFALLAFLAAPIGIPLFLTGGAALLCGMAAGLCVFLGAVCAALGGVLIGGKLVLRGLLAIPYSVPGFLMITGGGLLLLGLGILVGVLLWKAGALLERALMVLVKKILKRGGRKEWKK